MTKQAAKRQGQSPGMPGGKVACDWVRNGGGTPRVGAADAA